jgi:hypothetical protein
MGIQRVDKEDPRHRQEMLSEQDDKAPVNNANTHKLKYNKPKQVLPLLSLV